MKRILFSLLLLLVAGNSFAQKGFGIDGTIGLGRNGGDLVYPLLIEGRSQFNEYFSLNLGVGFWNTGLKGRWDDRTTTTNTLYELSNNKTIPSLQLSLRGQVPIFRYKEKNVRLFVEPKLYFLPFSTQTLNLDETYFTKGANEETYTLTGIRKNLSMKSESGSGLYGGLQVGLTYECFENIDLAISYGYTNMDLFKDLRGKNIVDQSLKSWTLDNYLPRKNMQQINISFLINFDLN